jgi:hypothetical protein
MEIAGFRPGGRGPFVSAKVAKTTLAVAWPFGSPAPFANPGGAQTRGACPELCRRAQTMLAFYPVLAAQLGYATRPGEMAGTLPPLIMGNELAESILSYVEGLRQGPPIFLSARPWAG